MSKTSIQKIFSDIKNVSQHLTTSSKKLVLLDRKKNNSKHKFPVMLYNNKTPFL